jgi:hypothetical protein
MKKFALLAIAALSFSVISCKEEPKVEPVEEVEVVDSTAIVTDSTATETPEVAADSVDNVVIETETEAAPAQ